MGRSPIPQARQRQPLPQAMPLLPPLPRPRKREGPFQAASRRRRRRAMGAFTARATWRCGAMRTAPAPMGTASLGYAVARVAATH
jgi:hypothetical protein